MVETPKEKIDRVRAQNEAFKASDRDGLSRSQRRERRRGPKPKPTAPDAPAALTGDEGRIEKEWTRAQHRYTRYAQQSSPLAKAVASGAIERLAAPGPVIASAGVSNAPYAGHRPTVELILSDLLGGLDAGHREPCPHVGTGREMFVECCNPGLVACSACLILINVLERCLSCWACGADTPHSESARERNWNDVALGIVYGATVVGILCGTCSRVVRQLRPQVRNARPVPAAG